MGCEGGVDVVGVVTPLVREGAQVLHGDQVVELSVLLEVHEKEEVEEDGEGQIEVESGEWTQRETLMYDYERGRDKTQEHLDPWGVCDTTSQERRGLRALSACSQVVQFARVGFRVIVLVVDVVCLKLVLSARVVVYAVFVQFS